MLDRANPLFDTNYAFTKAHLLATAAEDAPENLCGHRESCAGLGGTASLAVPWLAQYLAGVNGVGEIAGHIVLEQAYQMGKEV